jgi:alkylation response protein AidB-like acyl-CoA dehydrogenase
MPIALTVEQQALAESVAAFTAARAPISETRCGFDDLANGRSLRSWQALTEQGLLALHLPASVGGDGASLVELAVVLEETAFGLFPGPLLPSLLTGLVISERSAEAVRDELLPRFVSGGTGATSTSVDGLRATRTAAGWRVTGQTVPILGALSADSIVLGASSAEGDVWFVVDATSPGLEVITMASVDPTRDIGRLRIENLAIATSHVLNADTSWVRSVTATLAAAEAAGVARWAQQTGLAYAKVREQFGRPIGSFQAVKHKCARLFIASELVGACAWDAAVAFDQDVDQFTLAASSAAVTSMPNAVDVVLGTITLLGGIGYTWEHDAHLYWRRAMSLQSLLGPRTAWVEDVGVLARKVRRHHELSLEDEPEGLRAWVAGCLDDADSLTDDSQRTYLADHGLAAPHYPPPYGISAGPVAQVVIAQEFERAGVSQPSTEIGEWALPTILAHGTDEQREAFVGPTLRGEVTWCQLFSEPDAGSDLASLRTRASKVEGGWVLSGQKVWTSDAHRAEWGICLARTELDVPKHQGISYFVVDMRTPGVEIRPLREANGGYLFNEVFLNDVQVPDSGLVGLRGEGWALARTTLGNERVNIATGMGRRPDVPLEYLDLTGVAVAEEMLVRLGELTAQANAFGALSQRALLRQLGGLRPGPEASVLKVLSGWNVADLRRAAVDSLGPEGSTLDGVGSEAVHEYLSLPSLLLGGGTEEIQLNVISERVLGLPRT